MRNEKNPEATVKYSKKQNIHTRTEQPTITSYMTKQSIIHMARQTHPGRKIHPQNTPHATNKKHMGTTMEQNAGETNILLQTNTERNKTKSDILLYTPTENEYEPYIIYIIYIKNKHTGKLKITMLQNPAPPDLYKLTEKEIQKCTQCILQIEKPKIS